MSGSKKKARSQRGKKQQSAVALDSTTSQACAYRVADWCKAVTLPRCTFYLLPDPPATIKVGARRIVIESPADWLARVAKSGGLVELRKNQKQGAATHGTASA